MRPNKSLGRTREGWCVKVMHQRARRAARPEALLAADDVLGTSIKKGCQDAEGGIANGIMVSFRLSAQSRVRATVNVASSHPSEGHT
jgi:hypothetical protein